MPVVYNEAVFQSLYNVGSPTDASQRISYSRELYDLNRDWIGRRLATLPTQWVQGADVVVVGCGFGWLIEQLIDFGVSSVVGIDPSPFVQANKATDSRADVTIIDATVGIDSTKDIQSALQAAGFSRSYDVVISEDSISSQADSEIADFLAGCEDLLKGNQLDRIIHLITPLPLSGPGDSAINWKTMTDWAAYNPSHTWINIQTGEVA